MRAWIFARLLQFCEPAVLPPPWSELPCCAEARRGPQFPTATLARLIDEFTEMELLEAGVAKQDPDGALLPADGWACGSEQLLLSLRSSADALPFDLMCDTGLLTGPGLPIIAILADAATQELLATDERLLVAASMADVIVLRSLGLAATLHVGLGSLNLEQVLEICRQLDWSAPDFQLPTPMQQTIPTELPAETSEYDEEDDELNGAALGSGPPPVPHSASLASPDEPLPPGIMVVGWSPAQLSLERPAIWEEIESSLQRLVTYCNVSLNGTCEWLFTVQEVEQIQYLLDFGAIDLARSAFVRHYHYGGSERAFGEPPVCEELRRQDYLACYDRLNAALQRPCREARDAERLGNALSELLRAGEQELTQPLMVRAMAEQNPLRRNLTQAASMIARSLCRHDDLVLQAQAKLAEFQGQSVADAERQIEISLALVKSLVAICKQLS